MGEEREERVNLMSDLAKHNSLVATGDILQIPAGTHFDDGQRSYTFTETVKVKVDMVDYHHYGVISVDEYGDWTEQSVPMEYKHLPRLNPALDRAGDTRVIPDWSQFKVAALVRDWKTPRELFEEYQPYVDLKEKYERFTHSLEMDMEVRLKSRGRDVPKYPDDSDLMDWFKKEERDLLKWFARHTEDLASGFMEFQRNK